jgi:hypothetical protein
MEKYKARLLARGPGGEFTSLVSGQESEQEVKRIIFRFVQEFQHRQRCPVGETHPGCPFRIMAGLSHASVKDLINSMPLKDCLQLFEIELASRTSHLN